MTYLSVEINTNTIQIYLHMITILKMCFWKALTCVPDIKIQCSIALFFKIHIEGSLIRSARYPWKSVILVSFCDWAEIGYDQRSHSVWSKALARVRSSSDHLFLRQEVIQITIRQQNVLLRNYELSRAKSRAQCKTYLDCRDICGRFGLSSSSIYLIFKIIYSQNSSFDLY